MEKRIGTLEKLIIRCVLAGIGFVIYEFGVFMHDNIFGGGLVQIVKIDNDYYLTDSYYPKEWKKNIKKADRSNYKKLTIYKNLYLMDNEGNIYGYDLAKKRPVLIDKDLNILKYYYIYES